MTVTIKSYVVFTILFLPIMLYSFISEAISGGYTIGKKIMNIKVIDKSGAKINFFQTFIRWIFRPIDIILCQGAVAIIIIAAKGKGQRLGDILANTTVINTQAKNKKAKPGANIIVELEDTYTPRYSQMKFASDKDINLINESIKHLSKLEDKIDYNRFGMLARNKFMQKLDIPIDKNIDPEFFLKTLIKDYNYYFTKNNRI
jgi:hypothetical protein